MVRFYEGFYETYRVELVRFASQFDRSQDTAEDLFEDCHLALCDRYHDIAEVEYLKLMKTAIKNRYYNQVTKNKKSENPMFLLPNDLSIEEQVFRKEELANVMLTLQSLPALDKSILLSDSPENSNQYFCKKNRLKTKFKNQLNEKATFPENELIPLCPECDSKYMLFSMEDYTWTCDDCGAVSEGPLLIRKRELYF